jgi:hypothetical protein
MTAGPSRVSPMDRVQRSALAMSGTNNGPARAIVRVAVVTAIRFPYETGVTVLHKAPWDIERRMLIGMYLSIGPNEWQIYRRMYVCRLRTKKLTYPPRLDLSVI